MERHNKNKRGVISLNDVPAAVMTLVVIGIFLGVGALIMSELVENQGDTVSVTIGSVNETHAVVQNTAFTVNNASSFTGFSLTSSSVVMTNGTITFNSGNYTVGETTITPTNTSAVGPSVNWTYGFDYDDTDAFYNATSNSLAGLDDFSSFVPIIAIVIAAAVILGVVFLIRT